MGIQDEPTFIWQVPYTLNKRDHIITVVNKQYHKRTHKFGFSVPKTLQETLDIDKENGDHQWGTAIQNKMREV